MSEINYHIDYRTLDNHDQLVHPADTATHDIGALFLYRAVIKRQAQYVPLINVLPMRPADLPLQLKH